MLARFALLTGLATSTLPAGCASNMMQCVPSTPGGSCPSSDDTAKDVAYGVIGGIALLALGKLIYELVPLVIYMNQKPH